MQAGLIFYAALFEAGGTLTSSQSRSGTKGMTASGAIQSWFADSDMTTATGLKVSLTNTVANGAAIGTATCDVEFEFCGNTHTEPISGWQTSKDASIEADDLAVYLFNVSGALLFVVYWSEVRFIVAGSTVDTVASGNFGTGAEAPMNKMPSGIPPLGYSPRAGAGASMDPVPTFGVPVQQCSVLAADTVDLETTFAPRWRFKETVGGAWQSLPIELDTVAAPTTTCGVTATVELPTATTTIDGEVSASLEYSDETVLEEHVVCDQCTNGPASVAAEYDHFLRTIVYEPRSNYIYLLPNLEKRVGRMGDSIEYGHFVYRFGSPETEWQGTAICYDHDADVQTSSTSSSATVHPSMTEIVSVVGQSLHPIEDSLLLTTFAPYGASSTRFEGRRSCFVITQIGACPAVGEGEPPGTIVDCRVDQDGAERNTRTTTFPVVETRASNTDIREALDHDESLALYYNTVANPHQSFVSWFPVNTEDSDSDGIDDQQTIWQIDGDNIDVNYFLDMRQQRTRLDALPPEEDRSTSLTLLSQPLKESALATIMENEFTIATSLWGICRFDAEVAAPEDSYTYDLDSEDSWTLEDCTAAFGASIVVNPDAAITTCALVLDLANFSREPFLFAHICDRIMLTYTATNIDELRMYVVDITGYKHLVGTVSGTIYTRPLDATSPQYAVSYAQNHGEAYLADTGIDTEAEGASLATMTDEERIFAFMLLPGMTASRLRIEIDPVDPGVDCTIGYPTIYMAQGESLASPENGHNQNVVWADGPGVRYGNWAWFNDDTNTLQTVPSIYPPGYRGSGGWKSSTLDWLCFANSVVRGVDRSTTLATLISDLYDANEGQTNALVDAHTISFLTQRRQD